MKKNLSLIISFIGIVSIAGGILLIKTLENGRYNPSIMLAFKIARYFQMSIEEIFIYEEESKWSIRYKK